MEMHWCESIPLDVPEYPEKVFCDDSQGRCNENSKVFFQNTQRCVAGGAESGKCEYWQGPAYQAYTIVFVEEGLLAAKLGYVGMGAVICFAVGSAVGGPIVGLVTAVICAGITYPLPNAVNVCNFGYCKVDYTIPSQSGPNGTRCR